jgi:hypothetical protein
VFTTAAGLAVAVVLYERWTDPEKVRAQVLEQLGQRFIGARVTAESARFRLFGGIVVSDVRMARRDDLDRADFAYVPSLTIYLDKEQLLHGKQNVRKLELDRPRLRIVRDGAGKWNLQNLLGPIDLNERVPTIVIHHGTITLEDRLSAPQAPPLEIKDVNLTILNDPILVLSFAGSGASDLGPVQWNASLNRLTDEAKLSLEALGVPVGPALVQRLAAYHPELAAHARQLEGVGKIHAEFGYHPQPNHSWTHDVRCQLSQGKLVHARLPFPLEGLEATIRCTNGHIPLVKVAAHSGPARIEATLTDLEPDRLKEGYERAVKQLDLHVEHLNVTREFFASLPKSETGLHTVERDFEPRGPVTVDYTMRRDGNGGWRKHSLVKLEDVQAEFCKFPLLMQHLTGVIEQESATGVPEVVKIQVEGKASGQPVVIKGEIRDQKPPTAATDDGKLPTIVHIDVQATHLPIDEKLRAAMLPKGESTSKHHEIACSFEPTGFVDVQAFVRRDGKSKRFANRYLITFRQATMRYKGFRYPLENVTGLVDVQPDHWEFRDFHASHKGGEFRGHGRSFPDEKGDREEIFLDGANLLLDDELKAALDEELQHTWSKFQPSGRIDFTARIDLPPGPPKSRKPEIDLQVQARGCTIHPDFFKLTLENITGKVRYAKHWLVLDDLQAHHGGSEFHLANGLVYLKPGGGVWAQLGKLQGTPLIPDEELFDALPPCVAKGCRCLQWKDPVTLETKLVIDTKPENPRPTIYWDGSITLRNALLKTGVELSEVNGTVACLGLHDGQQLQGLVGNLGLERATLFKQPFTDIHSRLEISKEEPDILKLPGLYARFAGGEVYGPLRIEFGPAVRYEMKLTASRVKLEEFARQNAGLKAEMSGEATAQLYLAGRGDDLDNLKGNGNIDVPKGKIANLPPLVNLLKFLALRLPDRTAFEEAHIDFEIRGQQAHVSRLDLLGNAISLRGQGDVRLDGSDVNLDLNADWARFAQVLPPGIKQIPPAISNQLLRIKMRGSMTDPKFQKDYVPLVTDPVKKVWNEMRRDGPPPSGGMVRPRE